MMAPQVEDIVNTSGIFKGVLYFKSCEEPS
jgi:hypothetical protein